MSITTRIGDKGTTRTYSNETISKRSKRIVVCGYTDDLVSILGVAYAEIPYTSTDELYGMLREEITYIQRKLFLVGSEIATLEPKLSQLKDRIDENALLFLDTKRDLLESNIELPKGFILPGANKLSSLLDVARTACRKCEPPLVELYEEGFIANKYLLMWMNRLSDYLYLLARYTEHNNYRLVKE